MAIAALSRRKLTAGLEETIYRVLDAKFSSETATGVGKKTHVVTRSKDGKYGMMRPEQIEAVRVAWQKQLNLPEPSEALDTIRKSRAFKAIATE